MKMSNVVGHFSGVKAIASVTSILVGLTGFE